MSTPRDNPPTPAVPPPGTIVPLTPRPPAEAAPAAPTQAGATLPTALGWGLTVYRWLSAVKNPVLRKVLFWLFAFIFVVVAGFYFRDQRMATEYHEERLRLTEGVYLVTSDKDAVGRLTFPNLLQIPREGYGLQVWTLEQHRREPLRLAATVVPNDADFPLLLQFNTTTFDVSFAPRTVRRCRDGQLLYAEPELQPLVRFLEINAEGNGVLHFRDGTTSTIPLQRTVAPTDGKPAAAASKDGSPQPPALPPQVVPTTPARPRELPSWLVPWGTGPQPRRPLMPTQGGQSMLTRVRFEWLVLCQDGIIEVMKNAELLARPLREDNYYLADVHEPLRVVDLSFDGATLTWSCLCAELERRPLTMAEYRAAWPGGHELATYNWPPESEAGSEEPAAAYGDAADGTDEKQHGASA